MLDLKHLLKEAKQRIPPVLAAFEDREADEIDAELDATGAVPVMTREGREESREQRAEGRGRGQGRGGHGRAGERREKRALIHSFLCIS